MRQKILLLLLGVLTMLPALARDFEYTYEGQTLTYTVIDEDAKTCMTKEGEYSAVGSRPGNHISGNLIIPEVANDGATDYSVTEIGGYAFYKCSGLTSVEIPNSVTSIGGWAFSGCHGLTSVVIGNSVISIGWYAFSGCSGLTSVEIPNSVTSIGESAFDICSGLKKAEFSSFESLCNITFGNYAANPLYYAHCLYIDGKEVTEVVIPETVTSIGGYVFSGCSGLTSVLIPNSVTSIGWRPFSGCSGLKKSAYPNTFRINPFEEGIAVAYNPEGAFIENGWIWGPEKTGICFVPYDLEGEYSIPESVTSIGGSAFSGCSGLTSVEIPNSVTSIGERAFRDCSGLTSVVIPNSVTEIGNHAFDGCSGLIKSAYPATLGNPFGYDYGRSIAYNPEGAIIDDGFVYGPDKTAVYFAPLCLDGEYSIPETVTSIGGSAYWGCSGLTSVEVPNSVTSIGESAFSGCSGLTSVKSLPKSPAKMNVNSFEGLYDSVKLSVPDESVNNYLTTNWSLFKNIQNTSGMELGSFSDGVLEYRLNPTDMTAMVIGAKRDSNLQIPERFTDDTDGANPLRYYIKGIGYKAFYGKDVNSVEFNSRSQMEYIGDYAFAGTKISSITLPETIRTIGDYAFCGSKLSEIELKSGLSSIGEYAFSETSLKSVSIPETVSVIGNHAFYKSTISNVELNEGLVTIGEYAFANTKLSSVSIPGSVTSIESYTFYKSTLSNVEIKEGPVSIGHRAFAETNLSSVIIPKTVKEIESFAFYDTQKLSSLLLPEGLISIGMRAFDAFSDRSVKANPLYIPSTVETIESDAFRHFKCSQVDISDLSAWCRINFDNLDANPLAGSVYLYLNGEPVTHLQIPEGIEEIKPYSFIHCVSLQEVVFPNGLRSIETYGFSKCSNLSSLTFSDDLQRIGSRSFYECSNLTSIVFPKGLQSVGVQSFSYCSNLTSVVFSDGLQTLENACFSDCSKLTTVILPESLQIIEPQSFRDCYKIARFIIPSGVSEVGAYVCPALSVVFADGYSAVKVDDNAFYRGVNNLYWGRPLESLTFALNDYSSLELGNFITEIPDARFSGWDIRSLALGNGVQIIGNQAFSGCGKIDDLKFGSALQSIGDEAFSGCSRISEVVLPPSLETIGTSAFAGNSKLESIIMGHNVKTIGEKAFDGCKANTVSITAQTPPTAPNNTFSNYAGKLYLQGEKAKDAYYDAFTCWDRFDSYVMIDAEEIKIEGADNIFGKAGDTFQLTATVLPENVTLPQVFWRSTNPKFVTVDANGLMTLLVDLPEVAARAVGESGKSGSCTIIAETLYSDGPKAEVALNGFKNVEASGISLNESSLEIIIGQSATLTATVKPENATDRTVTWTSSDESVATVDPEGNVTAVSIGEAVITATCGSVSATCTVTVLPILIESLTIDPTSWCGIEDSEFTITATVLPENATDKSLTFKSSDTSVATVDAEGHVKVLKSGSCVITVSTVDGSNLNAECVITGTSGIEAILAGSNEYVDVYDMNGMIVKKNCKREDLKQLKPAVYIIRSGMTVIKATIR